MRTLVMMLLWMPAVFAQTASKAEPQWEYKDVQSDAELNQFTAEGWEFVSVATQAQERHYQLRKRMEAPPAAVLTTPVLLSKVEPDYTPEARAKNIEGTVTLYAEVNRDGNPVNIKVVRSLEPGLDAKAVDAVKKWRFWPATKGGTPVSIAATIEVVFQSPQLPILVVDRPAETAQSDPDPALRPLSILVPKL